MSTLINLLPDVRQAKLRDKSHRRLAISLMIAVIVAAAAILVIAFVVIQGQNLRINQLTSSISSKKQQEQAFPDVKTILSLQQRVAALPSLYQKRVFMTKLANTLSSIEPADVAFSEVSLDGSSLTITANGKSYLAAARIARALEQSNVTVGPGASSANTPNFSNVSLSSVSLSNGQTSYAVTATVSGEVTNGQ